VAAGSRAPRMDWKRFLLAMGVCPSVAADGEVLARGVPGGDSGW